MNHRMYRRGCEVTIAKEVVATGVSDSWTLPKKDDFLFGEVLEQAHLAEQFLDKFNIGYTDDNRGRWEHVTGGSVFFRKFHK